MSKKIDGRLLSDAHFYRLKVLREDPDVDPAEFTEEIARHMLVSILLENGDAREVRLPSGQLRIELTEKYLRGAKPDSATIEEVEDFVEIQTTINETTVPFVLDFFDTQCREVPGGRVDRDDMRRAYDTWCIKTGAELLPWEIFDQVFLSEYPNHRISKGVYENVELVEGE